MTHALHPWTRTLVALCAAFALFQFAQHRPILLAPAISAALAVAALATLATGWRRAGGERVALCVLLVAVTIGAMVTAASTSFLQFWGPATSVVSLVLAFAGIASALVPGRWGMAAFTVLLITFAVVVLGHVAQATTVIDVQALLENGIDAALAGNSPYAITIPNPYSAAESEQYFGPGVVENGRVLFGYPYLPAPLVLDVPAHLLGDVRWAHVAAVLAAGVLAWRLASDRIGRAAAVLIVVNPLTANVLISYWIEPVMVFLLSLTVWGMTRGGRGTAVAIGLLFASKQFAVSWIPALWSVARSSGWRTVGAAAAVGALVVGAFVLWDPGAFVHSAIDFHLQQPFRRESMSLLPGLDDWLGPLPAWVLAAAPLAGLVASLIVAVRARPGPTAFALGVGLSLLVTVLLSKQAHMNYYYLAGAALLLAVITWPRDDPMPEGDDQMREPSSQGSRGV
ncbi:MAG: hypothetical protein ABIR39_16000 [Nocardioides sp.]|uniref:hypothetical protein n=1 Tax=Nocardioides sp. TaxID=35761 RepID=UPI003264E32E